MCPQVSPPANHGDNSVLLIEWKLLTFFYYAGTVIDNKICHARNNDFYMCAHAGMIVSITVDLPNLILF